MNPNLLHSLLILFVQADDPQGWPQYNGSDHDRTSPEAIALREWSEDGPPEAWRVATNAGFSSFTVADGMAFTLVNRFHGGVERETCVALDTATGKELWSAALSEPEYDGGGGAGTDDNKGGDGPRSTPSYSDGRVLVLDSHLLLACFEAKSGKPLWKHELVAEYGGRLIRWQNAASPLVDAGRVFVAGGGEGQSLLAFDAATGEPIWMTGDERMTHATPIAATIHGVRQVIFYVQSGLISVDPATGEELWRQEYEYRTSSAASPVVFEELVYVSAGYGVGAGAFVILEEDGEWSVEFLWRKRNDLINHWSTPVCKDGYLYGMYSFKDYGDGPLQCIELATGEIQWSADGFGPGNCIVVGEDLVALSDAGEVVLIDAVPDEYRERARADVLAGKCWSSPAFADGQVYLRSTQEGCRIDLSERGSR